jgi:iron complex transport system substrate-binding protein
MGAGFTTNSMGIATLIRGVAASGLALCLSAAAWAAQGAAPERVVTLGGSVTEIAFALDRGDRIVADDLSSLYPEAATRLPRVGYYRATPVEGVVAMRPDMVLASEQAGPPQAIQKLAELGVNLQVVSDQPTIDSLFRRIEQVAGALDARSAGAQLSASLRRDLDRIQAQPRSGRPTLLMVNRTGASQGAGSGTAADEVLRLAGLTNVLAGQQGYKPLSPEALTALAPELIVITTSSLDALGGMDKLLQVPGVIGTPAARAARIVVMDDLLVLGLGPRLPQALRQLQDAAGAPARAAR